MFKICGRSISRLAYLDPLMYHTCVDVSYPPGHNGNSCCFSTFLSHLESDTIGIVRFKFGTNCWIRFIQFEEIIHWNQYTWDRSKFFINSGKLRLQSLAFARGYKESPKVFISNCSIKMIEFTEYFILSTKSEFSHLEMTSYRNFLLVNYCFFLCAKKKPFLWRISTNFVSNGN